METASVSYIGYSLPLGACKGPMQPTLLDSGVVMPGKKASGTGTCAVAASAPPTKQRVRRVRVKSFQFVSMRTVITRKHQLAMYSYLNGMLRNGTLTELVGFSFRNKVINRHVMKFGCPSYWSINRKSFEVDMPINLCLDTDHGPHIWSGYFNLLYWIKDPANHSPLFELLQCFFVCYALTVPGNTDRRRPARA